jgi:hypothetical protein
VDKASLLEKLQNDFAETMEAATAVLFGSPRLTFSVDMLYIRDALWAFVDESEVEQRLLIYNESDIFEGIYRYWKRTSIQRYRLAVRCVAEWFAEIRGDGERYQVLLPGETEPHNYKLYRTENQAKQAAMALSEEMGLPVEVQDWWD